MAVATADTSSAIRFRKPETEFLFEIPQFQEAPATVADNLPSDTKLGVLTGPILIAARWFPIIQRRISASIAPAGSQNLRDGDWLAADIAGQAIRFFQAASDVLPSSEPYIYASRQGDLVAEFKAPRGKMTNVIGKSSVVSFAVVDGKISKAVLELPVSDLQVARQKLLQLTHSLQTGKHAIVESK